MTWDGPDTEQHGTMGFPKPKGKRVSRVKINVKMFNLPNFMKFDVKPPSELVMDVGAIFTTDADAAEFWDDAKKHWLAHVQKRRTALGKSAPNKDHS